MPKTLGGILTGVFINPGHTNSLVTARKEILRVLANGLEGDKHATWHRGADVRAKYYTKETKIWNSRQISIVSEEELKETALIMNIPQIKPEWLGANICLRGIPNLSLLPPGTIIYIPDFYGGQSVGLYVTAINHPCIQPGKVIQKSYSHLPDLEVKFSRAAVNRRGLVAVVENAGCIQEGSKVIVRIPNQTVY